MTDSELLQHRRQSVARVIVDTVSDLNEYLKLAAELGLVVELQSIEFDTDPTCPHRIFVRAEVLKVNRLA